MQVQAYCKADTQEEEEHALEVKAGVAPQDAQEEEDDALEVKAGAAPQYAQEEEHVLEVKADVALMTQEEGEHALEVKTGVAPQDAQEEEEDVLEVRAGIAPQDTQEEEEDVLEVKASAALMTQEEGDYALETKAGVALMNLSTHGGDADTQGEEAQALEVQPGVGLADTQEEEAQMLEVDAGVALASLFNYGGDAPEAWPLHDLAGIQARTTRGENVGQQNTDAQDTSSGWVGTPQSQDNAETRAANDKLIANEVNEEVTPTSKRMLLRLFAILGFLAIATNLVGSVQGLFAENPVIVNIMAKFSVVAAISRGILYVMKLFELQDNINDWVCTPQSQNDIESRVATDSKSIAKEINKKVTPQQGNTS
ncbi:hypothetical protein BDQ17DRAFT_1426058 [Cyathus striatus]|nr:hypothetical protein BDQ17DRAFT_1426058 [Cyathus striatus]